MSDDDLPFFHDKPVKPEDLKPGMLIWSATMNGPVTVRHVVQRQSVIFMTAGGQRLTMPLAAVGGTSFFHMAQSQSNAVCELRELAHRLIDQGHNMLRLLDSLPTETS